MERIMGKAALTTLFTMVAAVVFVALTFIALPVSPALATPGLGGETGKANSYGKLTGRWFQWVGSIPVSENPLFASGEFDASIGQQGSVWFLTGTTGGSATRSCIIPRGKALFFPLVNAFFLNGPGESFTVPEKRAALAEIFDLACELTCTLDGSPIVYSRKITRVQSPPFSYQAGEDDVTGYPAGTVDEEAIADGYWVLLPPLAPGEHVLHLHGALCGLGFSVDVTYNLTVP